MYLHHPETSTEHTLCPILLGASLPLSPHTCGLHPSASAPELQDRQTRDTGDILGDHVVLCWKVFKNELSERKKSLWIAFLDFYGINIPTMANSKLPMCYHWTWSRKGGTRYFSGACRTSSRDITEERPSETLDATLPVDVPKATRAQLLCLSYSSWPGIQGGILPLLPCP